MIDPSVLWRTTMTSDSPDAPDSGATPRPEDLDAALTHVAQSMQSGHIATSAAKAILYSLTETLGALVGDPDLPSHIQSGYEGMLETAQELSARLNQSRA
jgi:hypothetical protein